MKYLISFVLVLLSISAHLGAARVDITAISDQGKKGGRSNFRRLDFGEPTSAPTLLGNNDTEDEAASEEELEISTTVATAVVVDTSDTNDEMVVTPTTSTYDENEIVPTGFGEEPGTPPVKGGKCLFCEEGIPDPDLVPDGTGGNSCAQVKETANDEMNTADTPVCLQVLQPLQTICCPLSELPSDGLPPAFEEEEEEEVIATAAPEEITTTTTIPAVDETGDNENDSETYSTPASNEADEGEDNTNDFEADPNAEVSTAATPASIGSEANDFVAGQDSFESKPTAATSTTTAEATATGGAADESETTPRFGNCVEQAQLQGNDDPIYACCITHPNEAFCVLNGCMDFESQVITCQCKKVKGIGESILSSNDPDADYLPDNFADFLGTFEKCCTSNAVSPSEFNDCYFDEVSEEIMEELEEEYETDFETILTYKPTPRPSSLYIPMTDDEDPISKEGTEDFSNGQKDDSLQGMINTYLDGVESPDEMKSDENVQVVAVSLTAVFLILLLLTAHLVMEHPDGLCASFCRLILKCLCCLIRVLCLPCRAICCKGSDQTRGRRTHAPMRAPFPSDLELA